MIAISTFGNRTYQNGDFLLGTIEFRHAFASEAELRAEFFEAGFSVKGFVVSEALKRGGAVLVKEQTE